LVFNELDLEHGEIDYTIRMNYSTVPTTRRIHNRYARGLDRGFQGYFTSGFLSLQALVDSYAIQGPSNATAKGAPTEAERQQEMFTSP